MKCPQCKDGRIQIEVHEGGSVRMVGITCITCDGSGEISEEKARRLEEEKKLWCRCDEPGDEQFKDDGEGVIHKHHYTCSKCGKITQIG